jgi:hypothetical protein
MRLFSTLLVLSTTSILVSTTPVPGMKENIQGLIAFSNSYISPTTAWEDITPPATQNWPAPPTTRNVVASNPDLFCQTFNVLIGTLELLKKPEFKAVDAEVLKQLGLLFAGIHTAADDFMVDVLTSIDGRTKHTTKCEEYVKDGGKPMMEALTKVVRKYFGLMLAKTKGDTGTGQFGLNKLSGVVSSATLGFLRTMYAMVKGEAPANKW